MEIKQTDKDEGTRKISIVIPVYFNEQSLPHLFEALIGIEKKLLERNIEMELIFVDDGSGDGSLKELLKIKERRQETKVIKLTKNFGASVWFQNEHITHLDPAQESGKRRTSNPKK